jgi:hypothetical protein
MFNKSHNDIVRTLGTMIRSATEECRFNEPAAIEKVAEWVKQDRRFDQYDPRYVAREAFDAKNHGRTLQLDRPYKTNSGAGTSVI